MAQGPPYVPVGGPTLPGVSGPIPGSPPLYPPPFPAPAGNPLPHIGNVGWIGGVSGTSLTFGVNANIGDGVVLFVGLSSAGVPTAVGGNSVWHTSVLAPAITGITLYVIWCENLQAANPTVTVSWSGAKGPVIGWAQIVGANTGFFIDGISSGTGAAKSATPLLHTTSPNDLLVSGALTTTAFSGGSFGANFTVSPGIVNANSGFGIFFGWCKAPVANSTAGPTASNALQNNIVAITVAIRTQPNTVSQISVAPPGQIPATLTYAPGYPPLGPPFPMTVPAGVTENLTGQTITSSEGTLTYTVSYALTGQTITSSEGTATYTVTYGLTGQTATFTEGTIAYTVSYSLAGQTATFAEGTIAPEVDYLPTEQTATFTEGTITPVVSGDVTLSLTGLSGLFGEGTITISGQDVVTQAGGTGSSRRRKIKRASEIFQEELAKLERQAVEATEQRIEVETKLAEVQPDTAAVGADMLAFIVDFERALRRAQAKEKRENSQLPEVPVYIRVPQKSAGVRRIEAYQRLKVLSKIARHREQVADERLRKVRERIDVDAATYFMQFLMWDD